MKGVGSQITTAKVLFNQRAPDRDTGTLAHAVDADDVAVRVNLAEDGVGDAHGVATGKPACLARRRRRMRRATGHAGRVVISTRDNLVTQVPEPGTIALFAATGGLLLARRWYT